METRSAIVVGVAASSGVGGACARRFAAEGMPVVLAGRSRERLEALAEEIRQAGGVAHPVVTDATEPAAVRALFERAGEIAPPGLVVYNAGNAFVSPTLDISAEDFERVWRVTCLGGLLVGQEAARAMAGGPGGSLLYTGATASLRCRPPFVAFASAKAALRSLAFGLAREFGPQGLHVAHVVIDGAIDGEMLNSRMPELRDRLGDNGMLHPDAIAEAYWGLHLQHPSAWSLEIDLRPAQESF